MSKLTIDHHRQSLTLSQKRRRYQRAPDDDTPQEKTPEPEDKLKDATTLYVGNLSFYTTEEQIHELFSKYVSYALSCTLPNLPPR